LQCGQRNGQALSLGAQGSKALPNAGEIALAPGDLERAGSAHNSVRRQTPSATCQYVGDPLNALGIPSRNCGRDRVEAPRTLIEEKANHVRDEIVIVTELLPHRHDIKSGLYRGRFVHEPSRSPAPQAITRSAGVIADNAPRTLSVDIGAPVSRLERLYSARAWVKTGHRART
jgi:hypothetical protein